MRAAADRAKMSPTSSADASTARAREVGVVVGCQG